MRLAIALTAIGVFLLIVASVSAVSIADKAEEDFSQLVRAAGGTLSHSGDFPATYKKMSANGRLLRNFYIGAAGLICLGAGIGCWRKHVEPCVGGNTVTACHSAH